AIPLTDLIRADAGKLTRTYRLHDGSGVRGELKGIAITACDDDGAAAPLLCGNRGGKKVVSLVTRRLGVGKSAGAYQLGQVIKLFEQLAVDCATTLIVRQEPMTVCRRLNRIPADEHRSRLLACIETQEIIRETDHGAAASVAASPNRFRQRVIGAVGERI